MKISSWIRSICRFAQPMVAEEVEQKVVPGSGGGQLPPPDIGDGGDDDGGDEEWRADFFSQQWFGKIFQSLIMNPEYAQARAGYFDRLVQQNKPAFGNWISQTPLLYHGMEPVFQGTLYVDYRFEQGVLDIEARSFIQDAGIAQAFLAIPEVRQQLPPTVTIDTILNNNYFIEHTSWILFYNSVKEQSTRFLATRIFGEDKMAAAFLAKAKAEPQWIRKISPVHAIAEANTDDEELTERQAERLYEEVYDKSMSVFEARLGKGFDPLALYDLERVKAKKTYSWTYSSGPGYDVKKDEQGFMLLRIYQAFFIQIPRNELAEEIGYDIDEVLEK